MQRFIIIVLLMALAGGAFISKPTDGKQSFTDFLVAKATRGDTDGLSGSWDAFKARRYADSCEYKDRIFWWSVTRDGQTVYVNAFSHWFNRAELKQEVQSDIDKAKQKASEGADQLNKTRDQLQKLAH
ncbi:MAG TPA: hypothetical protein VG326_20330 [Tepidisphaeraceae bacterium]|jgi:hypothetical protein|nr:hypothetical protein [Tepidisphaeraceae bacterium]